MRKEKQIIIDDEGRDQGKIFLIKEMPASQAEKWAFKTFSALAKGGVQIPEDVAMMGMAGIAMMGLQLFAGLDYEKAEPLLDEMFRCVKICPDPLHPSVVRDLIEDDIEEIKTRFMLRKEVFDLHTGFFSRVSQSISSQENALTKKS